MAKYVTCVLIILVTTIAVICAYWISDSFMVTHFYKTNAEYILKHSTITIDEALRLHVPPYQAINRLIVTGILLLFGTTIFIVISIREKILNKIRLDKKKHLDLLESLQKAKRLETVGTMAAEVAHDLNNMLSAMTTYPEVLMLDMDEGDPMYGALEDILEAGKKASNIVRDLSILSKGSLPHDQIVDINQLIHEFVTSPFLMQKIPQDKHIVVTPNLCKESVFVKGSETHLYKIIMNLTLNAISAIEESCGVVTIRTSVIKLDTPIDNYHDIRKGKYVLIEVCDTGKGIPKEDIEHIFDPFFTKGDYNTDIGGTGLGLTIVWAAVHEHSGYLSVESFPGDTKFMIYLPLKKNTFAKKGERIKVYKYKGSGEKILAVDDNRIQLKILESLLKSLEYDVTLAQSGEEALNLLRSGKRFDLIILDMKMPPNMSGCDAFKEIKKIVPNQKTIMASGSIDSDKVQYAMSMGINYFLHKPYSIKDIAKKIRKTLTENE